MSAWYLEDESSMMKTSTPYLRESIGYLLLPFSVCLLSFLDSQLWRRDITEMKGNA